MSGQTESWGIKRMKVTAASEMRDIRFDKCLVCFYGICRITTFDSSFTVPVITVFTASIKSAQHLLPSEILTAIIECEWHKTTAVFCDRDQNVACAGRRLKPLHCFGEEFHTLPSI